MHVSIVIASRNEGQRLARTVESCLASIGDLDFEIVVIDDASIDGSGDLVRGLPRVRVVRNDSAQGVAAAKDQGARAARGNILVFIDGHCKPEPGAIERLAADVGLLNGRAVVAPRVAVLDVDSWENRLHHCGNGYVLDLESFDQRWVPLKTLRRYRGFYVSPNLAGCCLAVSRQLYQELGGFDARMRRWGSEHVDFGLKAWLLGYRVVNDIDAVIGHRFQPGLENQVVAEPQIVANELRLARKLFCEPVWEAWLAGFRQRLMPELWEGAWSLFAADRASVEAEREWLFRRRVRDEFWYADEFGMAWPLGVEGAQVEVAEYRQRLRNQLEEQSRIQRRELTGNAIGCASSDDGTTLTLALEISEEVWGGPCIENGAYDCRGDSRAALYAGLLVTIIEGRTVETVAQLAPADLLRRLGGDGEESAAASLVIEAFRRALSAGVTKLWKDTATQLSVKGPWVGNPAVCAESERS